MNSLDIDSGVFGASKLIKRSMITAAHCISNLKSLQVTIVKLKIQIKHGSLQLLRNSIMK